jgi:type I restriction enzyme S subunit
MCDPSFIYYCLSQDFYETKLYALGLGAGQPNVSGKQIAELEILSPPIPVQQRIASILAAYDELIENSQLRIKILEAMARGLYREWFVRFRFPGHENHPRVASALGEIPQGWGVTNLGRLVEIRKGKNITKDTIRDGNVPVVAGGLTPAYYHDTPNTKSPVITISASGANAGFVNLYYVDVWASDCSFIDSFATPHVLYYYLWLDHRRAAVTHLQRGSAQPHVYPKDLAQLEALCVPAEVLGAFMSQVASIFGLTMRLAAKVENLRRTRDLLLPRLLSGQIEVEELSEGIAA